MFLANFFGSDPSRPSFFEMIAQQEMMPTLRPALKYVFQVFAQRQPRLFWLLRHSDSIFALILLFLENHHLKHYDASFAENFYGLKRVKLHKVMKGEREQISFTPISRRNRYGALLFLVVIPFIKSKLDDLYRQLFPTHQFLLLPTDRNDENVERRNMLLEISKRIFKTCYPFVNAFYEGSFFLYQLLYLYDRTEYFSPFLHLQGVTLKRLSLQEMEAQNQTNINRRNKRLRKLRDGGPLLELWKRIVQSYDIVVDYSKFLLPITIFLFKFLEWWYTDASQIATPPPIPPPPEPPKTTGYLPINQTECPLCKKTRTNPAVLPSGYAFCYPCIFTYVKEHHKCPVTSLPMDEDQIRKIYSVS